MTNADKLKRAAREFANAAISESWKGGGDPDNYEWYEWQLKKKRKKLYGLIDKIVVD